MQEIKYDCKKKKKKKKKKKEEEPYFQINFK